MQKHLVEEDFEARLARMIERGEDVSQVQLPSVEIGAAAHLLMQTTAGTGTRSDEARAAAEDEAAAQAAMGESTGCFGVLFGKGKKKKKTKEDQGKQAKKRARLHSIELDAVEDESEARHYQALRSRPDDDVPSEWSRGAGLLGDGGGGGVGDDDDMRAAEQQRRLMVPEMSASVPPSAALCARLRKEGKRAVNATELINEIGFGPFHYELVCLCGLGFVADSMWGELVSLVIAPVQNEWNIPTRYLGYFPSMLFVGMCAGACFWGRISDVIGRRKPFGLTLAISGLAGILLSLSTSYAWALVLLLVMGFGVGGAIPVDGAILAEFLPVSHRGSLLVSLSVFWSLGEFLTAVLAAILVPRNICKIDSDRNRGLDRSECSSAQNIGWRYLVFACGLVNCSMLLFRLGANESPNFLICQGEGGRARALNVLKKMAQRNGCPEKVTDDMVLVDSRQGSGSGAGAAAGAGAGAGGGTTAPAEKKMTEIFAELFASSPRRNLRLATPLIWLCWFGASFGLTMFGVFLPKFLDQKSIRLSSIYGDALIFAAAALPGPLIGSMLVESSLFGRRYTMAMGASAMCLLMFLFIFARQESAIVALACLIGLFSAIYYSALMCFTPEAYPTDIRTTASGIASGVRHLANIAGPIVGATTFGNSALYIASFSLMVAAIAAFFLPFDTRKRRLVSTVRLSV